MTAVSGNFSLIILNTFSLLGRKLKGPYLN